MLFVVKKNCNTCLEDINVIVMSQSFAYALYSGNSARRDSNQYSVFSQLLKVGVALCLVGVARPELEGLPCNLNLFTMLFTQHLIDVSKRIQAMLLQNSWQNFQVYLLTNSSVDTWPF